MTSTASEVVWINELLQDLHIQVPLTITLHCDNKAAQHNAVNPVFQ